VKKQTLQKIRDLTKQAEVLLAEVENLKDADAIKDDLAEIRDEQRDLLDAMSERVVDGEKGQAQADAVEKLDGAVDKLQDVADKITELKDTLQEVIDELGSIE